MLKYLLKKDHDHSQNKSDSCVDHATAEGLRFVIEHPERGDDKEKQDHAKDRI